MAMTMMGTKKKKVAMVVTMMMGWQWWGSNREEGDYDDDNDGDKEEEEEGEEESDHDYDDYCYDGVEKRLASNKSQLTATNYPAWFQHPTEESVFPILVGYALRASGIRGEEKATEDDKTDD